MQKSYAHPILTSDHKSNTSKSMLIRSAIISIIEYANQWTYGGITGFMSEFQFPLRQFYERVASNQAKFFCIYT